MELAIGLTGVAALTYLGNRILNNNQTISSSNEDIEFKKLENNLNFGYKGGSRKYKIKHKNKKK
jgi:hypothetical protein